MCCHRSVVELFKMPVTLHCDDRRWLHGAGITGLQILDSLTLDETRMYETGSHATWSAVLNAFPTLSCILFCISSQNVVVTLLSNHCFVKSKRRIFCMLRNTRVTRAQN